LTLTLAFALAKDLTLSLTCPISRPVPFLFLSQRQGGAATAAAEGGRAVHSMGAGCIGATERRDEGEEHRAVC